MGRAAHEVAGRGRGGAPWEGGARPVPQQPLAGAIRNGGLTMAAEAQTKPSDMILSLRLDALRKNLEQIMGMRQSILDGRKEVVELYRLAQDTEAGIEWRLDELDGSVRTALKAVSALQDIV